MGYSLKNMDAIEFIKSLKKDGKVEYIDTVITDPPYNISRDNNFETIGRAGISFGAWDYGFDQTSWIYEVSPLIKKGGSIIIFNDYKNMGIICEALEKSGFSVKDLIRWKKSNPMPRNTNRRYVTDFEFAIWATKDGSKWVFNKNSEKYRRPVYKHSLVNTGKNKFHPTQKPLKLMEEIILTHTNIGDIIFDPFMGSGSTGIAAIKNNRIFIGSEIDKNYYTKAEKRFNEQNSELIKNKKAVRSPLYYLGDKWKLLPQIYSKFPKKINTYIDPFSGGATMFANVVAKKYLYNDIDINLSRLIRLLKSNDQSLILKKFNSITNEYKLTNPEISKRTSSQINVLNKEGFNRLKLTFNEMKDWNFNKEMILLVLVIYGFNSQIRFNSSGFFNIPVGKQDLNENRRSMLKRFVNSISTLDIKFSTIDFRKFLDRKYQKDDFIYIDPPYLISNATYNTGWTSDDDCDLLSTLDWLHSEGIKWALSNVIESNGKYNKVLEEWSKQYYVTSLDFSYSSSNYQRKNKGKDKEVLITNYEV